MAVATAKTSKPAPLTLYERAEVFASDRAGGIDPTAGVVRDVRVLGRTSKNGRTYSDAALADAVRLFEGAPVYQNHPDPKFAGRQAPRGVEEWFGELRDLRKTPDGVYATLRYNPKHPIAEAFAWRAQNAPDRIGLSINAFTSKYRREKGVVIVEAIDQGFSVDLVDTPATNLGLYEQETPMDPTNPLTDPAAADATYNADAGGGDHKDNLVDAVSAIANELKAGTLSHEDAKKRITAILTMLDSETGDDDTSPEGGESDAELPDEMSDADAGKAVEQLAAVPSKLARWAARRLVAGALREQRDARKARAAAKLPALALTEQFLQDIYDAPTEARVDAMIRDRALIAKRGPISHAQGGGGKPSRTVADIKKELFS